MSDFELWQQFIEGLSVVSAAPVTFLFLLTLGVVGASTAVHWAQKMRYQGTIDGLRAQLHELPQRQRQSEERHGTDEDDPTESWRVPAQRLLGEADAALLWEFRYLEYFLIPSTVAMLHWLSEQSAVPTTGEFHEAWRLSATSVEERARRLEVLEGHGLVEFGGQHVAISETGQVYLRFQTLVAPATLALLQPAPSISPLSTPSIPMATDATEKTEATGPPKSAPSIPMVSDATEKTEAAAPAKSAKIPPQRGRQNSRPHGE